MSRIAPVALLLAALAAQAASSTVTAQAPQAPPAKRPDAPQLAPYVPTPQEVVDRMLALAGVIGLIVTLMAMRSNSYKLLSANYQQRASEEAGLVPVTLPGEA